jgi:hypothetical protein
MAKLKTGTRIKSAVCATEAMVIAAPDGDIEVTCGGVAVIDIGANAPAGVEINPDAAKGTALGKRYVNEAGDLELLCTKPGDGSLGANGEILALTEAKPLPASD